MNPYSIKDVSIKMKNKFSRISFVAVLAATIATVGLMAGCGSGASSSEAETKVVTETQIVTKVVNGVLTDENGNPIKDAQGNTVTAPAGTPDTDKSSKTEKNESQASGSQSSAAQSSANQSSGSQSSKSNSGSSSDKQSNNSSGSDKSSSKSSETPAKSSGDLKIGNQYFNVGDTVTCTYSLTCPKDFINFQATLNYDSSKLKATNAKMQGEAAGGAVVNHKLDGKVKFNGIKLGGYDYSDGGAFMIVTYEVVGKGEVSPSISWEVVTDMDMNPMISNGQLDSSFKITDKYE